MLDKGEAEQEGRKAGGRWTRGTQGRRALDRTDARQEGVGQDGHKAGGRWTGWTQGRRALDRTDVQQEGCKAKGCRQKFTTLISLFKSTKFLSLVVNS